MGPDGKIIARADAGPARAPAAASREIGIEPPPQIGCERRMHVNAYDYWLSLRRGRLLPAIADLEPERLAAFAANSVLIDLAPGGWRPGIAFLGRTLRREAGLADESCPLDEVPAGSMLTALVHRLADITAHRAPLGFEAPIAAAAGDPTLYRGILLPFSDRGDQVDFVYGVVNWRMLAMVDDAADIVAAVGSALAGRAGPVPTASPWDDAPVDVAAGARMPPQPLAHRIGAARTWAALAAHDRARAPAMLHAALGAAYDLLLATTGRAAGLAALGLRGAIDAAAIVALVFGEDIPRRDAVRYAAVMDHAGRLGLGPGMLAALLDRHSGGIAALAMAEARARRIVRHAPRPLAPSAPALLALTPVDPEILLPFGRAPAPETQARPGVRLIAGGRVR